MAGLTSPNKGHILVYMTILKAKMMMIKLSYDNIYVLLYNICVLCCLIRCFGLFYALQRYTDALAWHYIIQCVMLSINTLNICK